MYAHTIIPYRSYHTDHTIQIIPYRSYHTDHTIQIIPYRSYHTDHTIQIIPYRSYYRRVHIPVIHYHMILTHLQEIFMLLQCFKFALMFYNPMLLPAEIESKTLIPALRAILAKKLAKDHNIREDEISKMLGVTQAAVSNYIRGTRGDPSLIAKLMMQEQVAALIGDLCDSLSSDMAYTPSSLSKFIGLCNYIKSSLLICEIHHNLESDIDEQVCKECENMLLKGPGNLY